MGTYGVGGIIFLHTHFDTPPPAPSSKHQIYMRHITPLVVYTPKTTRHVKHQTSDFIHNPVPRQGVASPITARYRGYADHLAYVAPPSPHGPLYVA